MATEEEKKEALRIGFGGWDRSSEAFKKRIAEIRKMKDPEKRKAAIRRLSQDYEGLKDIAGAEVAFGDKMFDTEMPKGRMAGDVYVAANPLEHLSAALRQGLGAYNRKQGMDKLRGLSADWGQGLGETMSAGIGQDEQQPQGNHNMPIAGMAAAEAAMGQPQKPNLGQYGVQLGQNPQGAGMGQVSRAIDRRQNVRAQGGTPSPMGEGVIGQAKQAAGVDPKSNMLRAMGGMGKPNLGQYGAQVANAGMGQQTPRLPKPEPRPFTLSGMKVPQGVPQRQEIGTLFGAGVRPDQLSEEKQSLWELWNRNRR